MKQDQTDESGFDDAFEAVALDRIRSELAPIFWQYGHGLVEKLLAVMAEAQRVAAVIARDQADRVKEMDRKLAEIEVRGGVFINISSTVIEPTPEWLAKGEVRSFTPKQPEDTVRVIKSVRRVLTPKISRLYESGKLSQQHLEVCLWYRGRHEAAGLEGRYKSSNLSLAGNVGGGGGTAQNPMALHAFEAQARQEFRDARKAMPAALLRFFDAVVLSDVPIRRAARFARCHHSKVTRRLTECCIPLLAWCERSGIDLSGKFDDS